MKKLLYIIPLLLGMALTSCYDEDIENINSRLDAIENTQIATISQQITSINNSIQLLTDTDTELKGYIATLEKDVEQSQADIETLKAKDSAIEKLIAELRSYVDSELKSAQDWATATFATLEQYNALATELASLKTYVEGVKASLNNAISALDTSMKGWVNEQLTGYYTIAEIDAKLEALETATTEGDEALQKEIDTLKEQLASQKTELTEAYNKAIEEAINTNNGVINEKIAAEIGAINEKIGALEKRLDSLEERISAVEDAIEQIKALDITFDTTEKACMAGASVYIGYTIVGGDAQTTVEAFGDGGWSADIVAESATTGKVVVTAPSEISKRGKVVVLATSGAGGVVMKSLYFDEGVLTGILDTYEVDWEACTLAVTLKTNLSYSVEIPVEAQEWISIAESTRATVRTETITLSITENTKILPRYATLKIIGEGGDTLYQLQIIQHKKYKASNGYRALFVRFSGLEEGYSPYYIAAFDTLSKSEAYKNSYIEVVAHTYSSTAPVYCNLGIDKYYGISSFPTVICNNTTTLSNYGYEKNLQTLKKQIDSYHTDTPKVNIDADVRKDGYKYLIDVIIKVNDAGNYRVGGWLVEDNIEAFQYNFGCKVEGVDFNIHNGVLRATCGDTADEQFTGIDLGYLERNQIVERTLIIEPQLTSATNTQILNQLYCRAVVFVNEQDKNDEIMTVNTITTDYITSE